MTFSEFINTVFGGDIMQTASNWLVTVVAIVVSFLLKNNKTKLLEFSKSSNTVVSTIADNLLNINTDVKYLQNRIITLMESEKDREEQIKFLSNQVAELANIVAIGFLDTKGVSAEAKVNISKHIEKAVSSQSAISTYVSEKQIAESKKAEEVHKEIEQTTQAVTSQTVEAEATQESALELHNEILETSK